jgi:glyoxylase-like metal-dependent hydrolase (beta-lactamase superfamily II)
MTSPVSGAPGTPILPDYAPVPQASLGPAVNDQGYYVGRVERNLYWVTDGDYHSAFLTTGDGVVLFDAPPSIGHNLQRAVNDIAAAEGVSSTVTHLIYTHHHSDHAGASSLFGSNVVRIGHEETRRLLLRDNDPAKPAPEETFADHRTHSVFPEVREEPLGRGQGLPGCGGRDCRRARHRGVHRRAGRRGCVHGPHRLFDPGVDPPGPRLPHGRSPVSKP